MPLYVHGETTSEGSPMATIEIHGLSKRFGDVTAVDGLSFTAREGAVTGFLGPNGAGKSTTLRMLLGLVTPSDGTATIDGNRYADLRQAVSPRRRDARNRRLPSRSTGTRPPSHPGHRRRSAREARSTPCSKKSVSPTPGIAVSKGSRSGCASGSDSQVHCSVTRTVLILDEPANGLDPDGVRWLRQFVRTLRRPRRHRPALEPRARGGGANR